MLQTCFNAMTCLLQGILTAENGRKTSYFPTITTDTTLDWHIERANWSKRIFLINVQNFLPWKLFWQ